MQNLLLLSQHRARKMRQLSSILVFFLGLANVLNAQTFAYAHNSVQANDTPETPATTKSRQLTQVLSDLKNRYGVSFMYEDRALTGKSVSGSVQYNAKIEKTLDVLLKPMGLKYKRINASTFVITDEQTKKSPKTIYKESINANSSDLKTIPVSTDNPTESLSMMTSKGISTIAPADLPVKGKVNDENGVGLPGVSITIKGTQKGTTTAADGTYLLNVPNSSSVLVFSFVGYVAQEIMVGNQTQVNISLAPNTEVLSEVVVVGYGEQKKSDLTGAVASIQTKDIVRANPTLASKAIQGQVAGATVTKSDNRPGSGYNITIRGENTINNSTAPLVVIDGLMGGDINNLNPNDIQSMDILKDASSTAIYGARGANGVIIITTKKGISGKPRVSFDAYVGVKTPAHVPQLMSSEQFYKATYTDRILEGSTGTTFTAAELDNIKNGRTTDWVDLITKPGIQMSQNISVSGGNEKTTYRFSGGYLNEDGNVLSTNFRRYNLNAGLDSKLGEHFKVGFTSYVTYSNQNLGSQESLRGAYRARPTGVPYYSDLANPSENQDLNVNGLAFWMGINDKQVPNPLSDVDPKQSKLQTTTANIMGNAYVEYAPIKGLSIRSSLSATYGSTRVGDYRGMWTKAQIGSKPRAQFDNRTIGSYTLDNIINYTLDMGKHKLNFTGLQSAFYQRNEAYTIAAKDLPFDSDWYALNTGTITSFGSSLVERSLASYMGRVNYSFKDKYLLTVTGRSDGASQLADGNKWAFFPSVALAWRLIDEPFIQDIKALSNLKLRVSYGEVGNSTVNPYSTQASLLNTGYDFDGTAAYGFAPANLGNKDLRWERSKEFNFGLDFGLLANRISGSVEVYDRKTVDLILNQKIPTASGFSQVTSNIGKIQNKGIEILLNSVNIAKRDFTWSSTFTFTKNKNKLLELYGDGQTVDKGNKLFVGYPIKANFDYKFDGIWQTADKDLATKYKQVPGSVKVVDANNDGQISSTEGIDDRMYLGTQLPNFLMGLTNRFKYKNVDFSFFAYYRNGTQYNNSTLSGTFGDMGTRYNKLASLDYWRSDNPSNTYFGVVAANPYRGAINYQDASFLRISDITLGYNLPKELMNRWKLYNARIYGQVINPIITSKFTGFDPEFNSAIYQDDVPSMTISLGINVSF